MCQFIVTFFRVFRIDIMVDVTFNSPCDDEYRDEDFRDEEPDGFPYEDIDDIEDDVDNPGIKEESTDTYTDTTVDEGPSCPFCNFSFKGLSENVQPRIS